MLNIEKFINDVSKEKKIEGKNLKNILTTLIKTKKESENSYSGYNIKNSLETFFNYVSKYILEKESSVFYISKGNLYNALENKDVLLESTNSGFYENEVFFAKNIDTKFYNTMLVKFLGELSKENHKGKVKVTDKDLKELLTPEKISLFDVYKKIEKDHQSKANVIKHIFKTLDENNLINLITVSSDKLLFSSFNPLDLYNSWYINELFIDKGVVEEIF